MFLPQFPAQTAGKESQEVKLNSKISTITRIEFLHSGDALHISYLSSIRIFRRENDSQDIATPEIPRSWKDLEELVHRIHNLPE